MTQQPLAGIRVIDFTTLLPGPLASLMLARAGAAVIKIEPPEGEGMRRLGLGKEVDEVLFTLLNAGKYSVSADLKDRVQREQVKDLIRDADIVMEQFRPGVMDRLGLGYEALKAINPKLIYCSISGYGQTGPLSQRAGHDLNYMAETGILALNPGEADSACVPPVLTADIAGGAYPAFFNILLALLSRGQDGEGQHLDISMADNLFPFAFWALAQGWGEGNWPQARSQLLNGGTARYHLYQAKEGRLIAVGAIEEKFWQKFCQTIALPDDLAAYDAPQEEVIRGVADIIALRTSDEWRPLFEEADCCVNVVEMLEDAVRNSHFTGCGLFSENREPIHPSSPPPMPLPVAASFETGAKTPVSAPEPGQHNDFLVSGWPHPAIDV